MEVFLKRAPIFLCIDIAILPTTVMFMNKPRKFSKCHGLHYDAGLNEKVVLHTDTIGNLASSREFAVPETCVRDWQRNKKTIFLPASRFGCA